LAGRVTVARARQPGHGRRLCRRGRSGARRRALAGGDTVGKRENQHDGGEQWRAARWPRVVSRGTRSCLAVLGDQQV